MSRRKGQIESHGLVQFVVELQIGETDYNFLTLELLKGSQEPSFQEQAPPEPIISPKIRPKRKTLRHRRTERSQSATSLKKPQSKNLIENDKADVDSPRPSSMTKQIEQVQILQLPTIIKQEPEPNGS